MDTLIKQMGDLVTTKEKEEEVEGEGEGEESGEQEGNKTEHPVWTSIGFSFNIFGNFLSVFLVFFFCTAGIGAILQLVDPVDGTSATEGEPAGDEVNLSVAKEAAIAAAKASWLALKLWTRLVLAILVPASYKSFLITKEGWAAMQPSIIASLEWLKNAPLPIKLAFGATILAVVLIIALQREIKKRRIVERITASVKSVYNSVGNSYNGFANEVAEVTEFGAEILPHLIYTIAAGAVLATVPKIFIEFSSGFGGWLIIIGIPIIFSTRSLILYDIAYTKRIKMFFAKRQRRPSTLPKPKKKAPTVVQSVYRSLFGGNATEEKDDEIDRKDDGMLYVVGSKNIRQPVKTLKGVSAMGYPAAMDKDLDSAINQYEELQSVTYWVRYWTVVAVPLLFEQLPVSGQLLRVMPFWPPIRTLFAAWLQIPGTNGAHLAFEGVVPLVGRYWSRIAIKAPSEQTGNFVLSQMINFLPIPESVKNQIFEVLSTGGLFVVGAVPFLLFPPIIVNIAATIAGLGRPIYTSITSIVALESAANEAMTKLEDPRYVTDRSPRRRSIIRSLQDVEVPENLTVAGSSLQCTQWLEYWAVYSIFMFCYGSLTTVLFWFPLWFHLQLVVTLWLQLPYYRGSRLLFKQLLDLYYQLSFLVVNEPKKSRKSKKKKGIDKSKSMHVMGTLTEQVELNEEKMEELGELEEVDIEENTENGGNTEKELAVPLAKIETDGTRPMSLSLDDLEGKEAESGEETDTDDEQEEELEEPFNVFNLFWGGGKKKETPVEKKKDDREPEQEVELEQEHEQEENNEENKELDEQEGSATTKKTTAESSIFNPFSWGKSQVKEEPIVEEPKEDETQVEEEEHVQEEPKADWSLFSLFQTKATS